MWDLLEPLLEALLDLAGSFVEVDMWPRFYSCSVLSLSAAALIDSSMANARIAHVVCALVILAGVGTGILWERASR